jgi:hypothetical protein
MKTHATSRFLSLIVIFVLLTAVSSQLSAQSGPGDPVKLAYTVTDKSLSYQSVNNVNQTIDAEGQTVNVIVDNKMFFGLKAAAKEKDNLNITIRMDSLEARVESMQGSAGGKVKEIEGKTFSIVLSPLGKVIDMSEALKIEYTAGTTPSNLSQAFSALFPVLPDKAVKPGDTWTVTDSIKLSSVTSKSRQILTSLSKFEGYETIHGLVCAKISSAITGTMEVNVQNMGMDIYYKGPVQGTVTMYFAVKEGYFVKRTLSTKMNGSMEISGPQNMSMPVTMETKGNLELVNN